MSNPFDFFDNIFCINLPKRRDRRRAVSEEFKKIGILDRIEWVKAVVPHPSFTSNNFNRNPGAEMACNFSHSRGLVRAIQKGGNILTFEDDVTFEPNALETLQQSIDHLPEDWVVFFLGGNPHDYLTYENDHIFRVTRYFDQAHAYSISEENVLDFYDYWSMRVTHPVMYSAFDKILTRYAHKTKKGYCAYPPIAFQQPLNAKSDIKDSRNLEAYAEEIYACWEKFAKKSGE